MLPQHGATTQPSTQAPHVLRPSSDARTAEQPLTKAPRDAATAATAPVLAPEPLPPSYTVKQNLLWLTFTLVPYHVLNFVLGTVAFNVVLIGVCVSVVLLPVCGLGILVYMLFLQVVRMLAILDVLLANFITRSGTGVRWNVPDEIEEGSRYTYGRRMAPKLARISMRSTIAVLYFLSVKFVLGLVSFVAVVLPILPFACEFVADYASDAANAYVAGLNVKKFNFGTDPFTYTLVCIAAIIVGILLMHIFGGVSRTATRRVCSQSIKPTSSNAVV